MTKISGKEIIISPDHPDWRRLKRRRAFRLLISTPGQSYLTKDIEKWTDNPKGKRPLTLKEQERLGIAPWITKKQVISG